MADRQPPEAPSDARPPADGSARFEALVRGYARLVAHAVRRAAGRLAVHDRADVEQEVLISLWKHVQREQDIEHPASYVYKAAVRETVRAVTRLHKRAESPMDGIDDAQPVAPAGDAAVEAREQRAALVAALAALHPDRARAVKAHLAGWPVQDIMRMYGWPYQKARNLIARGMTDLRSALRERGVR